MKIEIEVTEQDVTTFFKELNKDEGMRERAVNVLMKQTAPEWVSKKTAVIRVLGAFSKAFYDAIEDRRLFNKRKRDRELFRLAFPNKE